MSGVLSVAREHENFLWLMANGVSQSMIELTEQMSTVQANDQDHIRGGARRERQGRCGRTLSVFIAIMEGYWGNKWQMDAYQERI